jgi:type IV pilus assembly protein PilB
MVAARKKLGELLVEAGALDAAGVQAVLAQQRQRGGRFGQIAVDNGLITEEVLVRALAAQLGVSAAQLDQMRIPGVVMQLMPKDVAMRWHVFPLGLQKENNVDHVYVATADPTNTETHLALQAKLGRRVRLVLAGERAIARAIQEYYFEGPVAFGAPGASYIPAGIQPPRPSSPPAPPKPPPVPQAPSQPVRTATNARLPPVPPPMPPGAGRSAALFDDSASSFAPSEAVRRMNAPTQLLQQPATGLAPPPATPAPDAEIPVLQGTVTPLDEHDDVDMDDMSDPEATEVGPFPMELRVDLDTPDPEGAPVAGSVYTALPSDGMVLQVKAMIRQRLVDDELVWVFIDKGLVTESEVT